MVKKIYTTNNSKQSKSPTTAKSPTTDNNHEYEMGIGTSYSLSVPPEPLDSKRLRTSPVTSFPAKRYKPRYALRLEVLHFRDTRSEAPVTFVTSLQHTHTVNFPVPTHTRTHTHVQHSNTQTHSLTYTHTFTYTHTHTLTQTHTRTTGVGNYPHRP